MNNNGFSKTARTVCYLPTRYIALSYMTQILDVPPSEEELYHVNIVFNRLSQMQTTKGASQ
jgi:hypothetical protein